MSRILDRQISFIFFSRLSFLSRVIVTAKSLCIHLIFSSRIWIDSRPSLSRDKRQEKTNLSKLDGNLAPSIEPAKKQDPSDDEDDRAFEQCNAMTVGSTLDCFSFWTVLRDNRTSKDQPSERPRRLCRVQRNRFSQLGISLSIDVLTTILASTLSAWKISFATLRRPTTNRRLIYIVESTVSWTKIPCGESETSTCSLRCFRLPPSEHSKKHFRPDESYQSDSSEEEQSSETSSSTDDDDEVHPTTTQKRKDQVNFLESLSDQVPLPEKHVDAKQFSGNDSHQRETYLSVQDIFSDRLSKARKNVKSWQRNSSRRSIETFSRPRFARTEKRDVRCHWVFDFVQLSSKVNIVWSGRLTATAGHCTTRRSSSTATITLSDKVCDSPGLFKDSIDRNKLSLLPRIRALSRHINSWTVSRCCLVDRRRHWTRTRTTLASMDSQSRTILSVFTGDISETHLWHKLQIHLSVCSM